MLGKIHFHLVKLLHFPLKVTPFVLRRQVLEQFLGWQFRAALAERGAGVFNFPLVEGGNTGSRFTLFFQRRLRIEGNTELGLHVKNLMDSIELESMPSILRFGLLRLAEFIKAGQKEGVDQNDHALSSC
ncbi:sterol carrier protein, SCP [Xenorhabdus sp. PB62.4]|nr:sterol carrier protein, SCP [Xenorhabdus sp. PB62.4]